MGIGGDEEEERERTGPRYILRRQRVVAPPKGEGEGRGSRQQAAIAQRKGGDHARGEDEGGGGR